MSAPVLDAETSVNLDNTDPADCAHIIPQFIPGNDIATAIVLGQEVTALCGYRFIPYRQPEGRPVCSACTDAYGSI